jgi:hypothetical protein
MTDSTVSAFDVDSFSPPRTLRFPGVVGLSLGLSLCLHLAAIVYFAFGANLAAANCVLCGQFLIGMALLRLVDGAFVFQDIRLVFLIFLFLYGGVLPLGVGAFGGTAIGLAGAAFMYALAIFGFNVVQWWYRQPWVDVPVSVFRRYRPSFANATMVFLGFVWILYYALSLGIDFSFSVDHAQTGLLGTQLWIVSSLAMNGMVMYMIIGWPQLTKQARVLVVLSVIAFIGMHLALGNRRDYLAMMIFLAGVVATKRHAVVRLRTVLIGFLLLVAFTIFGVIRQAIEAPVLLLGDPVQILVTQNEFVSPIQTLIHYVSHPRPLRLGSTYLTSPLLFLPRALWPDKPESLSLQFMRDAFGTIGIMGYAYTPVTEAYLNFAWIGPFLVFSIMSLLMVKLVKNANIRPGLYFISFALIVDFNRSDAGSTLYSFGIIGGAFFGMSVLSRIRWAPRVVRGAFPSGQP